MVHIGSSSSPQNAEFCKLIRTNILVFSYSRGDLPAKPHNSKINTLLLIYFDIPHLGFEPSYQSFYEYYIPTIISMTVLFAMAELACGTLVNPVLGVKCLVRANLLRSIGLCIPKGFFVRSERLGFRR